MTEKIVTTGNNKGWGENTSIEELEKMISVNKRVLSEKDLKQLLGENEMIHHGISEEQKNTDRY
ncbi:hypothetical protein KW782_04895 [Candidatus Parcubacteria bacterium]|nr:hypothetical protein [Candidatus Parcubacteria bacterium]